LMLHEGGNYKLYKGNHEDREIAVKMFNGGYLKEIANEAAIASRMSCHNNVLKLLGCCLETEWPILVFEYPKMGNLADCINRTDLDLPLALELRLRIAMKVANAVAYLHHGLSKKFIHGDIKSSNIFLDQNFEPKLDVYAFGSLFYEILTKKKIFNFFIDFSGPVTSLQEATSALLSAEASILLFQEENRAQVMEAIKLMEACLKFNPDDRPDMIEVAKALRLIINS
ncbi:hypothetical protein UlMin_017834, partial [Ulmus minor]